MSYEQMLTPKQTTKQIFRFVSSHFSILQVTEENCTGIANMLTIQLHIFELYHQQRRTGMGVSWWRERAGSGWLWADKSNADADNSHEQRQLERCYNKPRHTQYVLPCDKTKNHRGMSHTWTLHNCTTVPKGKKTTFHLPYFMRKHKSDEVDWKRIMMFCFVFLPFWIMAENSKKHNTCSLSEQMLCYCHWNSTLAVIVIHNSSPYVREEIKSVASLYSIRALWKTKWEPYLSLQISSHLSHFIQKHSR